MRKGRNRAYRFDRGAYMQNTEPCVFIANTGMNTGFLEDLSDYIMNSGLDVYFEKDLQKSDLNPVRTVTLQMDRGLLGASHILSLISDETLRAGLPSFESGYGLKANKSILGLVVRGHEKLPVYMKLDHVIDNKAELNKFLVELLKDKTLLVDEDKLYKPKFSVDARLVHATSMSHPLNAYLD